MNTSPINGLIIKNKCILAQFSLKMTWRVDVTAISYFVNLKLRKKLLYLLNINLYCTVKWLQKNETICSLSLHFHHAFHVATKWVLREMLKVWTETHILLFNQKQEETPFSLNAAWKNVTSVAVEREKKKTVLMGGMGGSRSTWNRVNRWFWTK